MTTRTETDPWGRSRSRPTATGARRRSARSQNFRIGGERLPREFIRALGLVKKAPRARQPRRSALLRRRQGRRIARRRTRCIDGELDDQFPLVVWQTGSGTQTNMNANEVIANRANELLGGARGDRSGPSTRTTTSTAPVVERRVPDRDARRRGRGSRRAPAARGRGRCATRSPPRPSAFADIVKIGRTHLQDATPLTLGQEISRLGRASSTTRSPRRGALPALLRAGARRHGGRHGAQRATRGSRERVARDARRAAPGRPFVTAPNKFAALAAHDALGARARRAATLAAVAHEDRERRALARLGPALRASASCASRRTSRAARSCRAR